MAVHGQDHVAGLERVHHGEIRGHAQHHGARSRLDVEPEVLPGDLGGHVDRALHHLEVHPAVLLGGLVTEDDLLVHHLGVGVEPPQQRGQRPRRAGRHRGEVDVPLLRRVRGAAVAHLDEGLGGADRARLDEVVRQGHEDRGHQREQRQARDDGQDDGQQPAPAARPTPRLVGRPGVAGTAVVPTIGPVGGLRVGG